MQGWSAGKIYFNTVIAFGVGLGAYVLTLLRTGNEFLNPLFWGLALVCIVTELVAVPLPKGGRLTASFAFLFASLLTQGLLPTMVIVAMIAVTANLVVQRRHWSLGAFNFAQYTLSYAAAQGVLWLGGLSARTDLLTSRHLPWVLGAMLTQLLANIVLVNSYIALEKRIALWRVLWEDDRWELLFTVVLSPLSIMMVALYHTMGLKGAGMIMVPLVVSAVLLVLFLQVRQSRQELAVAHEELSILHQVAQRISSQIDLGQTLVLIASEIGRLVPHAELLFFLLDPERGMLVSQKIQTGSTKRPLEIPLGQGIIGRTAQASAVVRIDQLQGLAGPDEEHLQSFNSALAVPIHTDETVLGAITLLGRETRAFDAAMERMLSMLATQAAIAIKNAQLYQTTQQLAITDGLTGVYNRRYFQRQLEAEFRRAPRFGYPIALILIDADHFKQFNDSHGHLLGDQVLRSIAQILRESVRETDLVARYGGEEFAVILPETGGEGALDVAERIRKNVALHTFWGRGQTPVTVTVSIGVCSRMAAETKAEELIDLADAALYEAKRTGRDRICTAGADKGDFILAEPRKESESRRRAPARQKLTVDAEAWGAYLKEVSVPLVELLSERLRMHDLELPDLEEGRWRHTMAGILDSLARQLTAPSQSGRVTSDQLVLHPFYPEIKSGVTALIQQGVTLTQSESLVLALCNLLGQHVQNAPFSPAERLHVMGEVDRFTHTVQLAISQVWHEFYQQTNEHLMVLHDLEQRITHAFELDELLQEGVRLAQEALRADVSLLFMPTIGRDSLRVRAHAGVERPEVVSWQIPLGAGLVSDVYRTLRPSLHDDLDQVLPSATVPLFPKFREWTGVRSAAFFPLAHQGDPLGVLICYSRHLGHFDPSGTRLGRGIAGQLAAAIARMQAQDTRQDTYLSAITALVEALEAKDSYAAGHSEHLVRYAVSTGKRLGLGQPDLETLRQAGYLHDLGKVMLPEAILHKPDRLTAQEREVVETHPEVGANLIASIDSLRGVVPVVRHHHEHWDGTGYPDGLSGEAIPLLARILAVAEAFEGMTTPKAYRAAIPTDAALREMRQSDHFDPRVLAAFCEVLAEAPAHGRES